MTHPFPHEYATPWHPPPSSHSTVGAIAQWGPLSRGRRTSNAAYSGPHASTVCVSVSVYACNAAETSRMTISSEMNLAEKSASQLIWILSPSSIRAELRVRASLFSLGLLCSILFFYAPVHGHGCRIALFSYYFLFFSDRKTVSHRTWAPYIHERRIALFS